MIRIGLLYKILFLATGLISYGICPGQYQFENYSTVNGLSDNRVTGILKDHAGFIWIGTENGLNRFDGHSFLVYNLGYPHRYISNPYVNALAEDKRGRIWVATQSGLNIIDPKADSTFTFLVDAGLDRKKSKSLPTDLIWDLYADAQDRIWMAPDMRDFCYFDNKTGKFVYFPWKPYIDSLLPHRKNSYNSIRKIYPRSADQLWLGTAAGLFSFTVSTGLFMPLPSHEVDHFISLASDENNETIFFTQRPGNSLQVLNTITNKRKEIPFTGIRQKESIAGSRPPVTSLRWITNGKELLEINTKTVDVTSITHQPDDIYSLQDGNVRVVYTDKDGLVWVGTSKGFGKFDPSPNPFHFTSIFPPASLHDTEGEPDLFRVNHKVHTVFDSQIDNKYYISSPEGNSLLILDKTNGTFRKMTSINGIALTGCSVIFEDSKGALWIMTNDYAFQYDRKQKKFTTAPLKTENRSIQIADVTEDNRGDLWIAAMNDGLYKFSPGTGTTTKMSGREGMRTTLPTSLYFEKKSNVLWIGSFEYGLYRYDQASNSFRYFVPDINRKDSLRSSLVTDITEDEKGRIWIATYGMGLSIYLPSEKRFIHKTVKDGLPENNIFSLAKDKNGAIWATSFRGLSKIDPETGKIETFSRDQGQVFSDFYGPINRSPSGDLITGVANGFLRFHPDSLQPKSPPFDIRLTSFSSKKKGPVEPDQAGDIVLDYSDNEVQFQFAALTYFHPGQTIYEYQLEGLSTAWFTAGNQHTAKYNNLSPGTYRFSVRATDYAGRRSTTAATLRFKILPPWWKTWWFATLALLIVSSIVIYLYRRRIRAIRAEANTRQQIAELKEQALRAQMNPHFIFNCLNAIQELIVTENYTASYQYLSKFSKLLRMVLNLSERNVNTLAEEIEMCSLYIELESLRFKNSFTYDIKVAEGMDADLILFPSLLVQPFIENAIWHGLMQKEGDKKLEVTFSEKEGKVTCTICDNGIGRKNAAIIKTSKLGGKHFASKAIPLTQQRLEALSAAGIGHSSIVIHDCEDEDGSSLGTKVEISISSNLKWHQ